jgi:hypothetical protein
MKLILTLFLSLLISNMFAQNWKGLPFKVNRIIGNLSITENDSLLAICGAFNFINDTIPYKGIFYFNGNEITLLGNGTDFYGTTNAAKTVSSLSYKGSLYVAGFFEEAGNIPTKNIARWNGFTWDSLPQRVNDYTMGLRVIGDSLAMFGRFDSVGNQPFDRIALFHNETFFPFPPFTNFKSEFVNDLIRYKGEYYAAGKFNDLDSVLCCGLLKLENGVWKQIGSPEVHPLWVADCLEIYQDELYVGGLFTQSEGNVGNYIQRWDGQQWKDVGGGTGPALINGQIHEMKVHDDKLYVVGAFQEAGGIPARFIATWDGTDWCGLGGNFDNRLISLEFFKDTLYVAGNFFSVDGDTSVERIAKWTGGNFTTNCGNTTELNEQMITVSAIISPNPCNDNISVQGIETPFHFEIKNLQGQIVAEGHSKSNQMDTSQLLPGCYLLNLSNRIGMHSAKIMKVNN